jgi:hypothetical protein
MKGITFHFAILWLLVFPIALGQQSGTFTRGRLLKDLAGFTMPAWEQREAAFRDTFKNADPEYSPGRAYPSEQETTTYLLRTLAPADKELFITSLVALLRREKAFEASLPAGGGVDEVGLSSYIDDLGTAVMVLPDPRSIPALLDIVGRIGPIDAIAAFGEPALKASLERLARTTVGTRDEELRMDLILLLSKFLEPANRTKLQFQSVLEVKNTFRVLANDPSGFVRENAVGGSSHFVSDPEIRALLKQLVRQDPESFVKQAARNALEGQPR